MRNPEDLVHRGVTDLTAPLTMYSATHNGRFHSSQTVSCGLYFMSIA